MRMAALKNTVCGGGTAFTVSQARTLHRYVDTVVICMDGDRAGRNSAVSSIKIMVSERISTKMVVFPEKHDPDSYRKQFGEVSLKSYVLGQSKDAILSLTEYKWRDATDLTIDQKLEVKNFIAGVIAYIPDHSTLELYCIEIARITGLSKESWLAAAIDAKEKIPENRPGLVKDQPAIIRQVAERVTVFDVKGSELIQKDLVPENLPVPGKTSVQSTLSISDQLSIEQEILRIALHGDDQWPIIIQELSNHQFVSDAFDWFLSNCQKHIKNKDFVPSSLVDHAPIEIRNVISELLSRKLNLSDFDITLETELKGPLVLCLLNLKLRALKIYSADLLSIVKDTTQTERDELIALSVSIKKYERNLIAAISSALAIRLPRARKSIS
jgi:DNA primase